MLLSDPSAVTGIFVLGASAGALVTYTKQKRAIDECRRALELVRERRDATSGASGAQFRMKALVVGRDTVMVGIFTHLFFEKCIEVHHCSVESAAIDKLSSEKYEAIVLDFDNVAGCDTILNSLPRPNQHLLAIAVKGERGLKETVPHAGVSFVVERPLVPTKIRELLNESYGRMLRDRRAYFRLPVELPVWVRRESGTVLECNTLNLSESGMAVSTTSPFQVGEQISIGFAVSNADIWVSAKGKVIWDDKHGKAGINFECMSRSVEARFFEWLHDQFLRTLGSQTAKIDRQDGHGMGASESLRTV